MTEGNTPAFPMSIEHEIVASGLTKREYFAAMAMRGLLANNWKEFSLQDSECDGLAWVAINYADALIEQLNK